MFLTLDSKSVLSSSGSEVALISTLNKAPLQAALASNDATATSVTALALPNSASSL